MFGFPHPNGFAIEPQFMGNLLLAPAIVSAWFGLKKNKQYFWLFFIFAVTIFLTFSRGAIYAFVVAMIFMTVFEWVRQKDWRVCETFLIIAAAFLFMLNLQGVMTQASPTNDTYVDGVAKVINQLSLGVIDIRESKSEILPEEANASTLETVDEEAKEDMAVCDGYVEESTDTRVRLTDAALTVWRKDFNTIMFGVGLGGAGQALYVNGLSPAPKEIVQNQYASLLLETGLVGVVLMVTTLVLIVRAVYKNPAREVIWTLILAYGITVCFFAGLPNALHIYLLPAILMIILGDGKSSYRK
jgi:O-antigen ligase